LPALLYLRMRALFGVGARADLITFFLTQKRDDFTAADTTAIGYSKRSLAELLDNLVHSGLIEMFMERNQKNYRFITRDRLTKIVGLIPKEIPPWRNILQVVLSLRNCVEQNEEKSSGVKMNEIRNLLKKMEDKLRESFSNWILKIVGSLNISNE
jgi:hypothetical protein